MSINEDQPGAREENARLRGENTELRNRLAESRLRAANLEAAMRAALGARASGDDLDPLDYLRWEMSGTNGGAHGA